jgi:hypothetical protein
VGLFARVDHRWFNRFRCLLIRWEKKAATYLAFVQLAATLIVYRKRAPGTLTFRVDC